MSLPPVNVASYNMYYKSGDSTHDDIEELSKSHQIFGLQEVQAGNNMAQIARNSMDTHEVFVGTAQNGAHDGEHSPIFYDKARYEAVATESVQIHGADYMGQGGPGRVANFVLLQDKTDGSTLLVSNSHWANNTSDTAHPGQQLARETIDAKIAEFQANYPVDGVVALGDFNTNVPNLSGMTGASNEGTHENGWPLDHILTSSNVSTLSTGIIDGGESDHNIVSKTIALDESSDDVRKNELYACNQGMIMSKDIDHTGDAWIYGYGTTPHNADWNDEVSSVALEDSTVLKMSIHSDTDDRFLSPENTTLETQDDIAWLGDLNDEISFMQIYGPPDPQPVYVKPPAPVPDFSLAAIFQSLDDMF